MCIRDSQWFCQWRTWVCNNSLWPAGTSWFNFTWGTVFPAKSFRSLWFRVSMQCTGKGRNYSVCAKTEVFSGRRWTWTMAHSSNWRRTGIKSSLRFQNIGSYLKQLQFNKNWIAFYTKKSGNSTRSTCDMSKGRWNGAAYTGGKGIYCWTEI